MIGQGSPSYVVIALARAALHIARPRVVCLALVLLANGSALAAGGLFDEPIRIRIAWGGTEESRWTGHVALDKGSLSGMRPISSAADIAASVRLENGRLYVASIRQRRFECVEVFADGPADAKLVFQLATSPSSQPVRYEVSLAELLENDFEQRIDERGNRLLALRPPDDAVRIVPRQEPLIFAPGEQFAFSLRLLLPNVPPGTALDVRTTLLPARGKSTILWSDQRRLPVPVDGPPAATLHVPLPKQDGVYNVHVSVAPPTGFRDRFLPGTANPPLAERRIQVVVLDLVRAAEAEVGTWESVLEIDPASPRWWDRLPAWTQVRRIRGLNRGPLGSIRAGAVSHPLGHFVELPATPPDSEPHWQAYPLPIEAVDAPHLLEIAYPPDAEAHFGVSIVEPNVDAGPFSRDSGVYIEGFGRSELKEKQVHRMVFWPRTEAPLLLVTNRHPTAPARFGSIRVLRRSTGRLTSAPGSQAQPPERLVAAYVARPVVADPTAAVHAEPRVSATHLRTLQRPIDDRQRLYEAATRLADYLPYAGYNGAVVSVLADGQAIYASPLLGSAPNETLRDATAVSERLPHVDSTDGLELLLRVFDRDRLALVPALRFSAPLTELERLRHGSDPQSSGLELVGPDGLSWLQTNRTRNGGAPYYNVLDQRVQQAMFNVVREVVQRYRHHPALAGVAIQLAADSYAQLPGLEWGLDDTTIARFERDTGVQLAAAGPDRFAARHALLTGQHADAWRTWRAGNVARFYGQLAGLLRYDNVDRRLLLMTEDSLADPQQWSRMRPNLLDKKNNLDRALVDRGIDRKQLESVPGLAVCPTRYVEPATPLVDRAIGIELSAQFAAWQRTPVDGDTPSALLYHPLHPLRLDSFDAKSQLHAGAPLAAQPLAQGSAARQPLVAALVVADPLVLVRGGEVLPMGGEAATRNLLRLLHALPTDADVQVQREQPITVRAFLEPQRTTHLVVNESPWTADVEVVLELPVAAAMQPLLGDAARSTGSTATQQFAPGRQSWSLRLAPYGVEGVQFAAGGIRIVEVRSAISNTARNEIERAIADLDSRDLNAPSAYKVLSNPGFEPIGGGLPGWRLTGGAEHSTAELDATLPRSGKTCLYWHSHGGKATIDSDPFPTPPTGQLFFTAWIRGENLEANTELRMVLETIGSEPPYRRYAIVGGAAADAQPLETQWQPYGFDVNDLPLDSRDRMRLKFELIGPGEVWIDDVQLHDVLFPLPYYTFSQQEKLQLVKLRREIGRDYENDRLADCVQLLESYWPRFLLAYSPPVSPAVAVQPQPPAPPQADDAPAPEEEKPPAVSGWRRYVPLLR